MNMNMAIKKKIFIHSRSYSSRIDVNTLCNHIDRLILAIEKNSLEDKFLLNDGGSKKIELMKSVLRRGDYKFTPLMIDEKEELKVCNPCDIIVMIALHFLLVESLAPYYGESTFSKYFVDMKLYDIDDRLNDYYLNYENRISEFGHMDGVILIKAKRSLFRQRDRLILKLLTIMDVSLLKIIRRFLDIDACEKSYFDFNKVFNYVGTEPKKCIFTDNDDLYCFPPYLRTDKPYQNVRYELFNFLLTDIDRQIDKELPDLYYARIYENICIPYTKKANYDYNKIYETIYDIFEKTVLLSPTVERQRLDYSDTS